jgi:hypothetical protein
MSDIQPGCPRHCMGTRGARSLPFYYRRQTRPNGETSVISVGPSVVWLAIALLLLLAGADRLVLIQILLRLLSRADILLWDHAQQALLPLCGWGLQLLRKG